MITAISVFGMLFGVAATPLGPTALAAEQGLKLLGKFPEPKAVERPDATSHTVFLVDSVDRLLYYSYVRPFDAPDPNSTYVREYDLTSTIPQFRREARLASAEELPAADAPNPGRAAIDRKRNRLLLLSYSGEPFRCENNPGCGGTFGAIGRIFVVDRSTLRRTDMWIVSDRLPGFFPQGLTYSPEDDKIYTIGIFGTPVDPSNLLVGNQPRNPPVAVVALEPENGAVAWIKPVPECGVQMSSSDYGTAIFRSRHRAALYFVCIRTESSYEPAGLSRLWIDPDADTQRAVNFPLEVFPISGSYVTGKGITGVASFDPATERIFMTSQSDATPGTWVFDGRLSAWVGFVAAPAVNNRFAAVDERNGRFYMGGEPGTVETGNEPIPGYLVISDGRQTPVPQGEVFAFKNGAAGAPIYLDSATRRLFIEAARRGGGTEWLVYQDRTPLPAPASDIDYDGLTTDVEEGANAFTTFAGSVSGFGFRVLLTGGTGGIRLISPRLGGATYGTALDAVNTASRIAIDEVISRIFDFQPSRADRGLFAARLTSLDLRNVGASAGARALGLDQISDGEYETAIRATANRFRSEQEIRDEEKEREEGRPDDRDEIGDEIEGQLAWPHREAFCLDGAGEATGDDQPATGGRSKVSCDLKTQSATASSSFEAFATEGISVGYSSFTSEVRRDVKLGIVTKTTALARGVELSAPGGTATIGRVTATATTLARGRLKTAKAEWERTLEGVIVKDAAGNVIYECTQAKSCDIQEAAAAMNRVLVARMRIDLPEPVITATEGGAFAGVEESDGEFLNGLNANNDNVRAVPAMTITVYNDWEEKSRLVVQLAAIQASSIYGITPLPGSETDGGDIPIPVPPVGQLPIPPAPILDGVLPPPAGAPPVGRLIESPLFLIRSPKQAFLFGLTLLLFAGAVAAIWRRRTLIRELNV